MNSATEQKILDAALKVFAKRGYIGATTLDIAEKAGFSEKTLFRKFKTKENLFNSVIIKNNEKIMEDFKDSVVIDKKFEDPRYFLESLIKNLWKFADANYEYIILMLNESNRIPETTSMDEINSSLSEYIEKNIADDKIDYTIFAITILSFIYSLIGDKHQGRTFINYDEAIEKFINNMALSIQQ